MQDPATIMRDHEKAVQDTEGEHRHSEEIHCCDDFTMIMEECLPACGGFGILWRPLYASRYSPLGDIKAQFQQFTMNTRSTPGRILGHHAEDQVPHFLADSLSTRNYAVAGEPIPVEPEAGTMPTNNSFRGYDYQGWFPSRPQPSNGNPEQPINSSKSGFWFPALQSQELLAKGQIFQQDVTSRMEASLK